MDYDDLPKTDPSRWRLLTNEEGVHNWQYLSQRDADDPNRAQTCAEKYFLGLPTVRRLHDPALHPVLIYSNRIYPYYQ